MKNAYINCKIYETDADALIVEDDKIVAVGKKEDLKDGIESSDELVDLKGLTILPGFVDSHMHLAELGYYLSNVILDKCKTKEDLEHTLRVNLAKQKEGEWLVGRGYQDDLNISRAFLDSISTTSPIALTRACGHIMSVNTKALEAAGIDADDENIDFENGILKEDAIHLIHDAGKNDDVEKIEDYILKGASYANAHGITTVGSDDFVSLSSSYENTLDAFEKMSYQDRLSVRVVEQCEFKEIEQFAQFLDEGYTFDVGNDYFRVGPLKLILDGSLGARSAAVSKDENGAESGQLNYSDEEVETFVSLANRFNMPSIMHAIGDRAVDQALSVFENTLYEGNPLHAGLVHCQILRRDQIEKIIQMNLSCYIQSLFIDYDASIVKGRVSEELIPTSYPYATLYRNVLTSNGSDAPVEMPDVLKGIALAVTRKSISRSEYSMNADECMTISEAVDSYTAAGAKQLFMDDRIGKIAPGYYADFVVLDHDIENENTDEILDTKIMMTVMGGKVVFER